MKESHEAFTTDKAKTEQELIVKEKYLEEKEKRLVIHPFNHYFLGKH